MEPTPTLLPKKGIFHNPRKVFNKQLLAQLKQWRSAGDEIVLFADLNEYIYEGKVAKLLNAEGLCMEEVVLKYTGQKTPPSHIRGSKPITGTFATPGIVYYNSYVSPHGGGVGYHRFQIHDFCAESMLGIKYSKYIKPTGRALRCQVERTVKKYNKVLKELML